MSPTDSSVGESIDSVNSPTGQPASDKSAADGVAMSLPPEAFDQVAELLRSQGPLAAMSKAAELLTAAGRFRSVFDLLCLSKRLEMGLPLYAPNLSDSIPEPLRRPYEDYVIDVCRQVADLFLRAGDIPGAWPYLKTIGETEKITAALESVTLNDGNAESLIGLAWGEAAAPVRGFGWLLERLGTCQAITVLESDGRLSPSDRRQCVSLLVRRLHADLVAALKSDIQTREGGEPETNSVGLLMMGRPWLTEGNAYHVDLSHLSLVVRMSLSLESPSDLALARELAVYGSSLGEAWPSRSDERPFDRGHRDWLVYLSALLGHDVDGAVAHFRGKIVPDDQDADGANPLCAQVLIGLLDRVGRSAEAVAAYEQYHPEAHGPLSACPSFVELCRRAGTWDRWAEFSRRRDDLVGWLGGLAQSTKSPTTGGHS